MRLLLILLMGAVSSHAASIIPVSKESDTSALVYLLKHGYVKKDEGSDTAQLLSASGLREAIKHFQVRERERETGS